jgi:hypothetical protein
MDAPGDASTGSMRFVTIYLASFVVPITRAMDPVNNSAVRHEAVPVIVSAIR